MTVAAVVDVAAPPRRPGRPSKVAEFRPLVVSMISGRPKIATRDVLEAVAARGFTGKKSALYNVVADVRSALGVKSALESIREAAARRALEEAQRRIDRAERRALRSMERENLDAVVARERASRQARERVSAKIRREREREDRKTDWAALQFRPTGEDEQSTLLRVFARRWFALRNATHKANANELSRWTVHLAPFFGGLEPAEVDTATIRAFVEDRLAAGRSRTQERLGVGLSSTTVRHLIATLSSMFSDLVDEGLIARNPVKMVPRGVKRLWRRAHDPRDTPFLERMEDIARLRASLAEPTRTLFSVAVMSGLRPGELVALEWADVRADMRILHVQRGYRNGKIDTPKSGKGRQVPISAGLAEVLREWRALTDGTGVIFKPTGKSQRSKYLELSGGGRVFRRQWHEGLRRAGLPYIKFYCATRHTFASQWVMAGQSIEKLSKILGHSSIVVTEVYAHLKPESMSIPDVISFGPRTSDPQSLDGMVA